MAIPRAWGGPELDPMTQFRVIEALAVEDGSVGWCVMIGCDTGYISAFLDQDVARATFSDLLAAMGAAATATGTATLVRGGYRISGRFPSSVVVNIANGCGSAATPSRTVRRGSMRTVSLKRGNALRSMRDPRHLEYDWAARHPQQRCCCTRPVRPRFVSGTYFAPALCETF